MSLTAYRARWIVPVDARPIEDGFLVVANGRIVSVTPHWSRPAVDLGDVAIIPGLVNCHTHLEFSGLAEPLQPLLPFTDWIRAVINYRRSTAESVSTAIQQGLEEAIRGGATLVGDIATAGWTWEHYSTAALRPQVVVFQELLGLTEERIAGQQQLAATHLAGAPSTEGLAAGLSPHAPYSVHPELFRQALKLAANQSAPVAVHLAETTSEIQLLKNGSGEFQEFLQSLGLWTSDLFGKRSCREWLDALSELPRALVIHGNYLTDEELGVLARSPQMTLVYCPRTHAAFGHAPHPWRELIELGGSVALGTDSRASNPDVSLWGELQFLATAHPDVPQHTLLRLGTLAGARALGRGHDCGTLTPGKRADVAVVALRDPAFRDPVYDLLAPGNRIAGTMVGGDWVYTDSLDMVRP